MMHGLLTVVILAMAALIGLAMYGVIGLMLKNKRGPEYEQQEYERTRLVQELYREFEKMEERVESLETLLAERESKREKS